ncbi:MAG: hypothetical protein OXS30_01445 [Chloroflexota bacterium]|nr:hypothetical protein [Chloroflexota bacterium]
MVTEAEQTTKASEYQLGQMSDRIVEQFRPEQVFLIGGRVTGQGEWVEVELLVILPGQWDYREKSSEIQEALVGSGIGKFIHLSTPALLKERSELGGSMEHSALCEGRVLYERR